MDSERSQKYHYNMLTHSHSIPAVSIIANLPLNNNDEALHSPLSWQQ